MIWPRSASPDFDTETGIDTMGDEDAWTTQYSTLTAATDYNDQDDDENDDDDDDDGGGLAWSQPPSPTWEANNPTESPFIPSAQPVSYPFSLPASGILPLTPPSPVRHQRDTGDSWVSEPDTDLEVDDMLEGLLRDVSGMTL
ncbi:hypothetical protein LLEC1_03993 [Akanthomyces lecanii]|uniref:Uncharacterized protein n=1 Tax=Cordyceps confragosa TaxID=2714763 RepID=A0A179IGY1_CORDF|nr:hypothetical protein LLEC1_03993 [Akanthomyces lecanii]